MEEKIKSFLKQLRLNESLISTLLGVVVVLIVGALLYSYFTSKPTAQPEDFTLNFEDVTPEPVKPGEVNEGETPKGLPTTHVVQRGEHLWSIAERYYGSGYNLNSIVESNKLSSPDDIEVGQELTIPAAPAKEQTVTEDAMIGETSPTASPQTITGDTYTTKADDTLWSISVRAYGDGYQWTKLYNANKSKLGRNSNKIPAGVELTIPR